jgi:hypothetical protein
MDSVPEKPCARQSQSNQDKRDRNGNQSFEKFAHRAEFA